MSNYQGISVYNIWNNYLCSACEQSEVTNAEGRKRIKMYTTKKRKEKGK